MLVALSLWPPQPIAGHSLPQQRSPAGKQSGCVDQAALSQAPHPVQVIGAACSVDEHVFEGHPEILFELERQACAAHVQQQDFVAAVQHCRQRLTPLASQHPAFLPALKVSLQALQACA